MFPEFMDCFKCGLISTTNCFIGKQFDFCTKEIEYFEAKYILLPHSLFSLVITDLEVAFCFLTVQ